MKTATLFFLTIGLFALHGCNQKTDVNAMLDNSETRSEIFDAIANNHKYMTGFMDNMQESDHAMQMMQGNTKMMGNMMQAGGMQMMMKDSMMIKNMMKDGKMMGNMMKMMHEKGMMSEDCMESCKKMMEDKGMDMNGMMGNMPSGSSSTDHSENH
ncbi:hypothetical protein [Euzebyella saccharophila]|jgi:hypothetical protein|uniref:Membrane or secreted protein n=1 Tax=Euzebyella saccharophila TaxID=679664 RepID=A0ABV8JSK3_9FLAO|nr:hypothetical protein [Euzebyella saccharophila]